MDLNRCDIVGINLNPKKGDEIVGFLENKKVVIHHKLCSSAVELIKSHGNMVYVEWIKESSISKYILIVALQNKKGELAKFVSETKRGIPFTRKS